MKYIAKMTMFVLVIGQLMLFSACNRPTQAPKNTDANSDTETMESAAIREDDQVLSLIAGQQTAYLNGEEFPLPAAPFIQNKVFYYPLEAVSKAFGGSYQFANDIATVTFSNATIQYKIGSHIVDVNGIAYTLEGSRLAFSEDRESIPIDEDCVPVLKDDVVFVPTDYAPQGEPRYDVSMLWERYEPLWDTVIIGNRKNEQGIAEVQLMDTYDLLPDSFRTTLQDMGVVGEVVGCDVVEYRSPDIRVFVTRLQPGKPDMDGLDGKVCALALTSDYYATPRGLRVGDTETYWRQLYGTENLYEQFHCKIADGRVQIILFHTRFYGSQLLE